MGKAKATHMVTDGDHGIARLLRKQLLKEKDILFTFCYDELLVTRIKSICKLLLDFGMKSRIRW